MPSAGREFLAPAGGFSVRPAFGPGQGAPPHAFGKGPADAFGKGPADVGLSNILYSERFKESSKFFFRREPGKGAHR